LSRNLPVERGERANVFAGAKSSFHGIGGSGRNRGHGDTIGIGVGRYTTIDRLGTPYSPALHVVERYRLLDAEAAKEAQERGQKEWPRIPAYSADPDYKGKGMQLEFTVEDANVFTMPWTALITYRRPPHTEWEEFICGENIQQYYAGRKYYSDPDAMIPVADKPDF